MKLTQSILLLSSCLLLISCGDKDNSIPSDRNPSGVIVDSGSQSNPETNKPIEKEVSAGGEACLMDEIVDYMRLLKLCERAQFSSAVRAFCIRETDSYMVKYPGIDCVIYKQSSSGEVQKLGVIREETLLNTRKNLTDY